MRDELRKFVVENYLFGRVLDFSDDDSFIEKGIIDSTGVLELVAHLEATYGIEIKDEELLPGNLDSINNLVDFVGRKTVGAAPERRSMAI